MELSELCQELKNWFEIRKVFGTFTIADGSIDLSDYLQEGQYFRIVGSVFNDGVYQYPASGLTDETFDGAVWAMAVPPTVIALLSDISAWESKYGEVVSTPYSSESFGGYSYSKAAGVGSSGVVNYKIAFADDLNRWRKV